MTSGHVIVIALVLASFVLLDAQDKKKDTNGVTKPLRALLISGGCCHDYPNQEDIISKGISERANVKWTTIVGKKGRNAKLDVYKDERWADKYDVIVHNECYGGIKDVKFVERICEAHKKGKPGVVIHCSMHSYRAANTDEWQKVLGVTSRKHEGHRGLKIEIKEPDHPIMIGLPKDYATPNGELYIIEKVWPGNKVLATAYGKDTKKNHPVIWANEIGKGGAPGKRGGRVFGTTLGHHNETMMQDEYLDFVTRGLLWACDKLQDDGRPKKGYEAKK